MAQLYGTSKKINRKILFKQREIEGERWTGGREEMKCYGTSSTKGPSLEGSQKGNKRAGVEEGWREGRLEGGGDKRGYGRLTKMLMVLYTESSTRRPMDVCVPTTSALLSIWKLASPSLCISIFRRVQVNTLQIWK